MAGRLNQQQRFVLVFYGFRPVDAVESAVSVFWVESLDSDGDPPQPAMDTAIATAIIAANAFLFIFIPPVW